MLHPFQIAIYEEEAAELREVYDYGLTGEESELPKIILDLRGIRENAKIRKLR